MGVIVDTGNQKEIDQLEAKGAFSLADTFRAAHAISIEALASMAFVPAEYQALVASTAAYQAVRQQRDEKTKANEQDQKRAAERAAFQRQLDANMLHFTIDGEDIEISQGDLRNAMKQRVKELEEQKKELLKNGGNPEQIQKVNNLIDAYNPVIKNSETNPVDPSAIKKLTAQDPTWAAELKQQYGPPAAENNPSNNSRSSFSSEHFNSGGITAPPLTATFMNSATQTIQPPATPTAPTPLPSASSPTEPRLSAKNNAGAMGF